MSVAVEDGLDVVTIRIEHKRSIIPRPSQAGCPVIRPACLQRGSVEGIDLSSTFGREGGVLPHGVRVETINPEDGKADSVTDAVGPDVLRYLDHSA